ncbi:MAG: phosphatidylserine/phosphatidylglycerophosphate/cardiolipin synthase family protein [Verrucomicrobia bacterium]|nr:phosphatidylserine/phosphatidylglycerophosphate/cardiolipin synthase family protein [Verrucomicrobiota bacterium]
MPVPCTTSCRWLRTSEAAFREMLAAIDAARESVRLETYIFVADPLGEAFRQALVRAAQRGARVRVLIDALGSMHLSAAFWEPLTRAGGEFRWFNPLSLGRLAIRDHRKMLVCDDRVAFVGGFNLAAEFQGDGVTSGWRDVGLTLTGPLVTKLAASFDEMFARADFRHPPFPRLRRSRAKRTVFGQDCELLLSGPGRERSPIKAHLLHDLRRARQAQIMAGYFLPPWRLRRALMRVARRGGRVQLMLAGQTDVQLSQLASRGLYQRLLRAGVEIYEYQPRVFHAKLIVLDDTFYAGSSNLDPRSLHINYELLVRLRGSTLAQEAREIFAEALTHCEQIDPQTWRRSRTLWNKLKERWAHFVLARLDPYVAQWQLRHLR